MRATMATLIPPRPGLKANISITAMPRPSRPMIQLSPSRGSAPPAVENRAHGARSAATAAMARARIEKLARRSSNRPGPA